MPLCKRTNSSGELDSPRSKDSTDVFTPAQAARSFSLSWIDSFHVVGCVGRGA